MAGERAGPDLEVVNGTFRLPNGVRVNIPQLKLPHGSLLMVVGPNGGGKTSLASFLCGLRREQPSNDGKLPTMCWQHPELVPGTVFDNLNLVRGGSKYALSANCKIDSVLQYFDLFPDRKKSAAAISGGQAQRINVARTFLTSRFGMVLDEPSASLDHQGIELLSTALAVYLAKRDPTGVSQWIADLEVERRFVVCVTHDRTLIERLASVNPRFVAIDQNTAHGQQDRIITIDAAKGEGYTLNELRTRPPSLYWAEFFDARNIFYTNATTPVDSLRQLRRRRAGTLGFVVIPDRSVLILENSGGSQYVQAIVREIDVNGRDISLLVEFQNSSGDAVPIWVTLTSPLQPWMTVGGEVWISMAGSLTVTPQIAQERKT